MEFLALDHIDNDGAKHTRGNSKGRLGRGVYNRLKRHGYPALLRSQVLCWNCRGERKVKRGARTQERQMPPDGETCYCGTKMTQIQSCRYQCPNCGALLDCEDVSGLPK